MSALGQGGAEAVRSEPENAPDWAVGYAPLPDIPDEFIGPDGRPQAVWSRFLDALSPLPPEEIERRFVSADRHIRDRGVSYRTSGEAAERFWPLSHLPLLIEEAEWRAIEAGVAQRARVLEAVLGDLYGAGRLATEGALPAAALAGSADYLREVHGIDPPGGRYLHIYAADLGRGPDGRWWVLSDRAQAPSGMGYALENRLVLSRAFTSLYQGMNVERLAPFFGAFRDGLRAAAARAEPRIGLLTPGPYSETYFEQATLARYLGFLLVEGDDLLARDGRVQVRTIAGLKRVDVLWRRVDADDVDPLELNAASRLGVPGLLEILRQHGVVVANMPGTGAVESRALLGFMRSLSRRCLGEDLALPHIATWWCGQASARAAVLDRLETLAITGAYNDTVPGFPGRRTLLVSDLTRSERERLAAGIKTRGVDYVGQEVVRLSTTPVWENGHLTPRPFVLRVFAAATPEGWRVMPGGFCRIAERLDARAVSMGEGARSADVWVVGQRPVPAVTLLPSGDAVRIRRIAGQLPSRAADNLFWLGRYLERAEVTLRLVRALCTRTMSGASRTAGRLQGFLVGWGAIARRKRGAPPPPNPVFEALHGVENPGAALSMAQSAQRAASSLRERLSPDAWVLIAELGAQLEPDPDDALDGVALERVEGALRILAALAGLAQENMNRVAGWRFLEMGRRIERGIATCRFARQFADKDATADDLEALLDLADSQISYRSRYLAGLSFAPVMDMVALDPFNPRSIAFQVTALSEHLASLPTLREDGILEPPRRLAMALSTEIATAEAADLDAPTLLAFEQNLLNLAEAINARYFPHGATAARPEKLAGLA